MRLLTRDEKEELQKLNGILDYCLSSLKSDFQEILNESYFNVSYKFWWVDYYSKSAFYRRREKAITSFVSLFEMINENFISIPGIAFSDSK